MGKKDGATIARGNALVVAPEGPHVGAGPKMTIGASLVMISPIGLKSTSFEGLDARLVVSRRSASIARSDQYCAGTNTRRYPGIREILTAVGWLSSARRTPFQAGVLALRKRKVELLFVTLDKSDGYHERITYHDYAISAERFHWQSQNTAGPDTTAGRRYLESPANGWSFQLFVRQSKGEPYRACGPVTLERAEGGRPMSIYWRLVVPLPNRLFQKFSILRGE